LPSHNLLDGISPEQFGAWAPLWSLLHVKGQQPFGLVLYPLIPWVGVMALGYALGIVFEHEPGQRRKILMRLGTGAIAAFVVIRALNVYGDPDPWRVQDTFGKTLMSFMDVEKYPPSLLYLLATLGPGLIALAMLESARGRLAGVLETSGSVPLFVYILHIVVVHLLAGVLALAMGYGPMVLTDIPLGYAPGWGFGLAGVYVAWLAVLAMLYPACGWYAALKKRRRDGWLFYL
jgi:uncharacterized membrane protein